MADNDHILKTLEELKSLVMVLVGERLIKEFFEVEEFSRLVGKAPYTVRRHCRSGRIGAVKRLSGRGKYCSWAISRSELQRYQQEGLLPKQLGS